MAIQLFFARRTFVFNLSKIITTLVHCAYCFAASFAFQTGVSPRRLFSPLSRHQIGQKVQGLDRLSVPTCQNGGNNKEFHLQIQNSRIFEIHHYVRKSKTMSNTALLLSGQEGFVPLGSIYMILLSLQYAFQPLLAKRHAPKTIVKGVYVLVQDLARIIGSLSLLLLTGTWEKAVSGWVWSSSLSAAGLPALLYLLQNYCSLQGYQNLPPITYNVISQTKTLSAAAGCYFLLGLQQSTPQVFALILLLVSALVMESIIPIPFLASSKSLKADDLAERRTRWRSGVIPALTASLLSGMAGALSQQSLQVLQRNSLLFSLEMATLSASFNLVNLLLPWTPDGRKCRKKSVTVGWTAATFIPIASNAAGGILAGLVTQYAGVVRKGFSLIQGMFLSGIVQNKFSKNDKPVTTSQWIGGVLAAISFTIFTLFPLKA